MIVRYVRANSRINHYAKPRRLAQKRGFDCQNTLFVLKDLLHTNPMRTFTYMLLTAVVVLAYLHRLAERDFDRTLASGGYAVATGSNVTVVSNTTETTNEFT